MKKILIMAMVFGLAACGESDMQRSLRESMEKSCYAAAINKGAPVEIAQKRCACVAKKVSSSLSDKEIKAAEASITSGGAPGEKVTNLIGRAAVKCNKK